MDKTQIALARIEKFVQEHPNVFLTFSGGKDSTVVLHLLRQVQADPKIAFFDTGFLYRQTYDFVKMIQEEWNVDITYIFTNPTPLEIIKRSGHWEHGVEKRNLDLKKLLIDNYLEKAQEHFDSKYSIYGLRADESKHRKILLNKTQGLVVRSPKGVFKDASLAPIWDWTTKEVNQYILQNRVPLNAAYRRLRELGIPADKRRTGVVLGDGLHLGDWAINYQVDPGLGKLLESHLPMLREYR